MHSFIIFDGKNSLTDFGCYVEDGGRIVGTPPEIRTTQKIPYSNVTFDFSDLYGLRTFGERMLTYNLVTKCQNMKDIQQFLSKIRKWLQGKGKKELIDSTIPDYHFNAVCTEIQEYEIINNRIVKIPIVFVADPYMISIDFGETIWDNIIFDTDNINLIDYPSANTAQGVTYEVYNFSKNSITPKFTVTGTTTTGLNCYLNSIQHVFTSDVTDIEVDGFTLKSGKNILHLQGVGTLAISMIEEVL